MLSCVGDHGGLPDGVTDADAPVVVAFISTPRTALIAEAGDMPGTMLWIGVLLATSVAEAVRDAAVILPVVSVALAGVIVLWRYRRLRASGRLDPTPVTVALDGDGVVYAASGSVARVPWHQWLRAYRRFGVWYLKLAAAPTRGVTFPDSALEPEQRVRLLDLLEDQDLLRGLRR
jgi:hypothetical protein